MDKNRPDRRLRSRPALACLVVYWILLFLATHWPDPGHEGAPVPHLDKALHFASYAGLAALVALVAAQHSRAPAAAGARLSWKWCSIVLAIVSTYGWLDETTQPLTGRDFEWLDWMADTLGTATGTLMVARRGWYRSPSDRSWRANR